MPTSRLWVLNALQRKACSACTSSTLAAGSVYMATRYFAEPTTMLKSDSLKGGNLVKQTPYPIFLPIVVRTVLDVYDFFSGAERLKRLGGEVGRGTRDPGSDQHGDWGLVPSSLGLIVVRVAQFVAVDEQGESREAFLKFMADRTPGYCTSWMYGGNRLLFYRAGTDRPRDGQAVFDGLECKIWHTGRLGMHARDLFLLADALEAPCDFPEFRWRGSPEPVNAHILPQGYAPRRQAPTTCARDRMWSTLVQQAGLRWRTG